MTTVTVYLVCQLSLTSDERSMNHHPNPPLQLQSIRVAVKELGDQVSQALRTQIGDVAQLGAQRNECLRLMVMVQQVSNSLSMQLGIKLTAEKHASVITAEEILVIEANLASMITHLDAAAHDSADPPDSQVIETTHLAYSGRPGRPRIEIDPNLLGTALEMRGPTHLAPVFNASACTIRRRALEYGLAEPGHPVYVDYKAEDGSTFRVFTSSTAQMSDLSDDALDGIMRLIIETFPSFGRRMIQGHL
jgi:hypothetical protein